MLVPKFNFKFIHGKMLYWQVLLSFIGMALLIVLSTSLIFSALYIRNIYRQLAVDSTNNIQRLTAEFDSEFKKISEINLYLNQVPDVNTFLYSANTPDYLTINRADILSRRVVNLSSYLHSILIYNQNTGQTLISGKPDIDKAQFFDGKLRPPATISFNQMIFSQIPSRTSNKPITTIAVIFNDTDKPSIAGTSSIIMILDREEVEAKLLANIPGNTLVVDNAGTVLFSNQPRLAGSIAGQPYFRKIRSSQEASDSFKGRVERKDTLISFTRSNQTGFYLINLRSPDSYTGIIIQSELTIVGFSVLILVIFLLVGYVMSNKLYSPINQILKVFAGSQFADDDCQTEEIATISKVFHNALQHIEELETRSEDTSNKLKEEYLRRSLRTGTPDETEEYREQLHKLNITIADVRLICIKIDNYASLERNRKFAYETTLCSIIPEILAPELHCETVNMYEGEIAVLLDSAADESGDLARIGAAMDRLRQIVRDKLQITLSVGIGGPAGNLEECFTAYQPALEMVKHRFVLGPDRTIHPRLLEAALVTNTNYPAEMVDKLIKALRLNHRAEFEETLQSITGLLKQFPYQRAALMILQIITECIKTINNLTQQDSTGYYLYSYDFGNIINSFETLDQAEDWLIRMFADYQQKLDQINQLKNNKHYKLVAKMQDYIKEHYQDPNLSVESVATLAGYTSYYFSKIFKEITGLNVVDYIKQLRINRAKELLSQNEVKVSEIPNLIGFTNPGHFYATFKNDVGLTPSAYREYILNR